MLSLENGAISRILQENQKKLGLPQHKLIQDIATCWNSTLDMLEGITKKKKYFFLSQLLRLK